MLVLSRRSGLLTRAAVHSKLRPGHSGAARLDATNRFVGGITRPSDLRVITRGSHLGGFKPDQSLPPDTLPFPERVPASSRESDSPQVLQRSLNASSEAVDTTQGHSALLSEISTAPPHLLGNTQPRGKPVPHIDTSLFPPSAPQPSFASQQTRGFHTSPRVPYDSTSYNVTDVPDFFIKYKEHRATPPTDLEFHGLKHEDLGLMHPLTDSILSGDVVASTRRLKAKIPVEHQAAGGHIMHPSGFVVPGPGHTSTSDVARAKERERNERKDRAAQTAAVAHRVLESDFEQVDATTLPPLNKVPFEVCELDGTVKHPSGFVPPTPAHKFRYTVNTSVLRDRKVSAVRQKARQPSPPRGVLRAMHTTSAQKASGDV